MYHCKLCCNEFMIFHSLCDKCEKISEIIQLYGVNIVFNTLKKNEKKLKELFDNSLIIKDIKETIKQVN